MKRLVSTVLLIAMLLSIIPTTVFAVGGTWSENAPTVTLTASELSGETMSVTIHVSKSNFI